MNAPIFFLKATVMKQITVPGYYRKDGTYIPPHQKTVHVDPDVPAHMVISGKGTSSQKLALKKLAKLEHWANLADEEKHAHILSSATNIQKRNNKTSAITKWKAAIEAGKNPPAAKWAVVAALPDEERNKLHQWAIGKIGAEKYGALVKQASSTQEVQAARQRAEQAAAQPTPQGEAEKPQEATQALPKRAVTWEDVKQMINTVASGKDGKAHLEILAQHSNDAVAQYAKKKLAQMEHPEQPAAAPAPVEGSKNPEAPAEMPDANTQASFGNHVWVDEAMQGKHGHYKAKAAKLLSAESGWSEKTGEQQKAAILEYADQMQKYSTAQANVWKFKQAAAAGKEPSAAQKKAFKDWMLTMPEKKVAAAVKQITKRISPETFQAWMNSVPATSEQQPEPKAETEAAPAPASKTISGKLFAALDETELPSIPLNAKGLIYKLCYEANEAGKKGDEKAIVDVTVRAIKELGSGSPGAALVAAHANDVLEAMKSKAEYESGEGPKDGDTKPGANGSTLVFKDGHWHAQEEAPVSQASRFGMFESLHADVAEAVKNGDQKTLDDIKKYLTDPTNASEPGAKEMLAHVEKAEASMKPKDAAGSAMPTPPEHLVADVVAMGARAKKGDLGPLKNYIESMKGHATAGTITESGKKALEWAEKTMAWAQARAAAKAAPEPASEPEAAQGALAMPDFIPSETKPKVLSYYQGIAQKIIDHAQAGNVAVLEDMKAAGLKPNSKGKVGNTWKGGTKNSKLLLALYEKALEHAKGGAGKPEPKPHVEIAGVDVSHLSAGEQSVLKDFWAMKDKKALQSTIKFTQTQQVAEAAKQILAAMEAAEKTEPKPAEPPSPPDYSGSSAAQQAAMKAQVEEVQKWYEEGDAAAIENKLQNLHQLKKDGVLTKEGETFIPWLHGMLNAIYSKGGVIKMKDVQPTLPDHIKQQFENTIDVINNKVLNSQWIELSDWIENAEKSFAKLTDPNGAQKHLATAMQAAIKYAKEKYGEGTGNTAKYGVTPAAVSLPEPAPGPKTYDDFMAIAQSLPDWNQADSTDKSVINETAQLLAAGDIEGAKKKQKTYGAHASFKATHAPMQAMISAAEGKAAPAGTSAEQDGPKEGDIKQGAKGWLVLKNGHWVKLTPDDVKVPDFAAFGGTSPYWPEKYKDAAEKLKAAVKEKGPSALNGIIKYMSAHNKVILAFKDQHFKSQVYLGMAPTLESQKRAHAMYQFVLALSAAGGKKLGSEHVLSAQAYNSGGAAPAEPAPAPQPKIQNPAKPAAPAFNVPPSIDGWTKVGEQQGYNPGGTYEDADGTKWYCKFPEGGEDVAKNELLALKLYEAAGAHVPEMKLVTKGGKVGTASKIVAGLSTNKEALAQGAAHAAYEGFAADAWLANWDTVGNNPAPGKGFDNIQFTPDGKAWRIDAGGSMHYKGTGAKKPTGEFGSKVNELTTMLDAKINKHTAAAFGKMSQADIKASVAKVLEVPDDTVKALVARFGPGSGADKMALAKTLIARKADMAKLYPDVAEKVGAKAATESDTSWVKLAPGEKIVDSGTQFGVPFAKIEIPAKGFNPDGFPKPFAYDKSSSQFVNAQNTADIQKIYDAAVSGKGWEAIENLKFEAIDKATGEKSGKTYRIDEHPSKLYVKEYFNQVVAEAKAQLQPTYRTEHNGSLVNGYNDAAREIAAFVPTIGYEQFKGWKDKAADYIVLDRKAGEAIPQPAQGQFHNVEPSDPQMKAFKASSDANYHALSSKERSALQAYTGSSYIPWNSAMRMGLVDSSAFESSKTMRDAFDKAAVELPDGIILHRGIGVGGETYKSIVGAVIQDGSFQSTSYGSHAAFSSHTSQLRIHVTKGVKAMMATTFSNHSEREVILSPNTRYIVTKVETNNGHHYVDVIALPHES